MLTLVPPPTAPLDTARQLLWAATRAWEAAMYAALPLLFLTVAVALTRDPWVAVAVLLGSAATAPLWRAVTGPWIRSLGKR